MAFNKNTEPAYVQGISEASFYDVSTGDLLYWTNKVKTGDLQATAENTAIEGGVGNKLLANIQHTTRVSGTIQAADFSLVARGLTMGSTPEYNGVTMWREKITATTATLTVSKTPAPAYGQSADDEAYACYVGTDGVNYGVNASGEVQGFTAEVGKTYCVQYYTAIASAYSLAIPANFSSITAYMVMKTPVYGVNGKGVMNSSLIGVLYEFIPRVQFIGGDAGLNGSQTEASTTDLSYTALAYDDTTDETCTECESDSSVYGYMVYVPCGDITSAVKEINTIGGGISVAVGATKQLPVIYVMEDGSYVTPDYTSLTYTSAKTATATVSADGVVTGVAAGTTTITITVTSNTALNTTASVTVTA